MSAKRFTTILGLTILFSFIGGVVAVHLLSVPSAMAKRGFFDSVAVGMQLSSRGEAMRVKGWTILGEAGVQGGQITFMPPDGTGFYSIDNAGGQRLRFSGGSRPGQYEYMTISHPGMVKINGNLQVLGAIVDKNGKPFRIGRSLPPVRSLASARGGGGGGGGGGEGGGKADGAGSGSLQALRDELNAIWNELEQVRERVNVLSR